MDEGLLDELLTRAVADAAPEEVMPEVSGAPGWTLARREAFLAFHRARRDGLTGPEREQGFAVIAEGRPVGVGRIRALDAPGTYEIGIWIGRSARGRGIAGAAVRALGREVRDAGGTRAISRRRDGVVEVPLTG